MSPDDEPQLEPVQPLLLLPSYEPLDEEELDEELELDEEEPL